jgi:DNA-binding PadR family transcriptional regulator
VTDAELAVLGLVVEKSRHGYEIEQVIAERDMREWTEVGFSSIYYLLKKLEKSGLVRSRTLVDNQYGPARKEYEVTAEGYAAWREAILDVLTNPRPRFDSFQLGLSSLPAVSTTEALIALRIRHEKLTQTLEHIQARRINAQGSAPAHVYAMFDLSIMQLRAEIQWLEHFIERLGDTQEGE